MIQIEQLTKLYRIGFLMRPKLALQDANLSVGHGEVFGFIGPNGAGKSTTIKLLVGLLQATSGSVTIKGLDPQSLRAREFLGYLPEHPYFYDYLSGRELLSFMADLYGLRGALKKQRINWALEMVGAQHDWADRRLRTYSKGMVQRIGLAQAILNQPQLLVLDEPMSGLDPLGRRDVRRVIAAMNEMGTTIFYSSHVLADVEALSHRLAIIVDGKIVQQGTCNEILSVAHAQNLEEILSREVAKEGVRYGS